MGEDHKNEVEATALDGSLHTLEEDSTAPMDREGVDELSDIPIGVIETKVERFFHMSDSFLGRGLPYIDRIFYDRTLNLPHVWLVLKVPISDPSEATLQGVRDELQTLSSVIKNHFKRGVVISAELN